jgi:hypothetical protein
MRNRCSSSIAESPRDLPAEEEVRNVARFRRSPTPSPAVAAPGARSEGDAPDGKRLPSWPSFPPAGYLGQLEPRFQESLAVERAGIELDDCDFYHCVRLPDGRVMQGPWDLRGREGLYLGGVEVAGRRVLELGPSTGYLSYFLERQGADVVCFDAGYDVSIDLLPAPGGDSRQLRQDHAAMVGRFQNSWWYLHRAYGSRAQMVYGSIYSLPGDIGQFDIATFGAILLHLRSPIAALEEAARRTTGAIVVTEPWPHGQESLHDNVMRIFPSGEAGRWVIWWSISAGAVVEMLKILGFGRTRVVEHSQLHQHGHVADAPYVEVPMYTVVGEPG